MASSPIVISRRSNLWERTVAQWIRGLGVLPNVALGVSLVVLMGSVYLYQVGVVERQIDEMVRLETDLAELNLQNNELSVSVAGYEDISRIKSEAKAMGLGEATHVEYLEVVLDGSTGQSQMLPGLSAPAGSAVQPSAWVEDKTALIGGGSWVTSTIMQQFRSWIDRDATARGAE